MFLCNNIFFFSYNQYNLKFNIMNKKSNNNEVKETIGDVLKIVLIISLLAAALCLYVMSIF